MRHVWCGEDVDHRRAWRWQDQLVAARAAGDVDDVVLTLTHPPVYTAGRHADLAANVTGARPDIPVVPVDRGGDVTYHGPGQLVAYPIVGLARRRGVKAYVQALERAVVRTVASFGIQAGPRDGRPGVWVGPDKICAVGVRVSGGVTKHGLALNVAPDLDDYAGIVACGIPDGGVTSLAALGVATTLVEVRDVLVPHLATELRPLLEDAGSPPPAARGRSAGGAGDRPVLGV